MAGQGRAGRVWPGPSNLDISIIVTYCNPFCQDTAGTIPFGSDPCLELICHCVSGTTPVIKPAVLRVTPFWRARGITRLAKLNRSCRQERLDVCLHI